VTRQALKARLGAVIDELKALEAHVLPAPGHGLCLAAGLMLSLLLELLERQEEGAG
jgi:hypothetical protein